MAFLSDLATHLKSVFAKINHNHDTAYEAKNSNIQSHISAVGNPHGATKGDIGLGNVTNDAQIKKNASSTNGNIPVWSGTSGDTLGGGYTVATTISDNSGAIPTAAAVNTAINNIGTNVSSGIKPAVQDITALKALNTTNSTDYPDKVMILVEDYGQYRLDRDSSATESSPGVIQPTTGTGRWIRIANSLNSHNLQSDLQGGATDEKYHLSAAQYNSMPADASGSNLLIAANNAKLSKIDSNGQINIDDIVVTSAQWTAIDTILAS